MKMKSLNRLLFVAFALAICFSLASISEAQYIVVASPAPAIITKADFINPYTFPSPSHLSVPGQVLRSADGYLFTYDTIGRRYYVTHPSYVLAPKALAVPAAYTAAPYYFVHTPVAGVPLSSLRIPYAYPGPYVLVP
ncbi:MAG: hypothetical protein GX181_07880 [Synergistaceae bacterium]|nr:hypothetical protein [Synergistota bacterium]NLM71860.1 hypothetical protein [Synergistaceae bacterium]